jgi:YD repeat-containing protein
LNSLDDEIYFDDVRMFPYDGSMKCYVYDPENLRFVAELDERHFATFYEYDEEGRLTRIKKETERGIMTIQESKTSTVKRPNE